MALNLSKREYYRDEVVESGAMRGTITFNYVKEIYARYLIWSTIYRQNSVSLQSNFKVKFNLSKTLLVIEGPTASGKTALAIELGKALQTVVLSADSRQFYKEVQIGTAKPSLEEQAGIKHYFIDSHSLSEELTSAEFAAEANEILKEEFKQHETIILVSGSGMFIDALCIGLDEIS